ARGCGEGGRDLRSSAVRNHQARSQADDADNGEDSTSAIQFAGRLELRRVCPRVQLVSRYAPLRAIYIWRALACRVVLRMIVQSRRAGLPDKPVNVHTRARTRFDEWATT